MNQPFPSPLDQLALAETWCWAWSALGRPAPQGLRQELEQAWDEPHRHYHDRRHLGECLALWSRWRDQCERPGEVAVALWFHDAIYDPQRSDNELNSAAWAARSLNGAGLASEVAQRVFDLVMATRHSAAVNGQDAAWVVDIDLAILGAPDERFEAYDGDVRKEYAWVPGFLYCSRRAEVLRGFLQRARLYHSCAAIELLEDQARLNLEAALSRLAQ